MRRRLRQVAVTLCHHVRITLLVLLSVLTLVSGPASPAPAPRLAFVTTHHGEMQIAAINVDGSAYRLLTRAPGMSQSPRWSPDGRRIVFTGPRGVWWQINVMNADGTGRRRLTNLPGDHLFPVWSPDGRRILYVIRRGNDEQICVMNADGSGPRRLTDPPGRNTVPVWSPDGMTIAFVSTRDGVPELYVMRADGSLARRQTTPERIISDPFGRGEKRFAPLGILLRPGSLHPAWSPDGRQIAFAVRIGRAEQQVSVADVRSGVVRRFATGYAPSWSADGSRLAFVVARVGDAQIYVANAADATTATRLTGGGTNLLPTWSPDGTWIAFLATGRGGLGVYVIRPDGSGRRRLADAAGDLSMLPVITWRPR